MTNNPYDPTASHAARSDSAAKNDSAQSSASSKKDAAKNEAGHLKNEAASAGQDVKETAKDQAAAVKDEVTDQAKDLLSQLKTDINVGQITSDLGQQVQGRAASTVRSLSDEINALARGEKPESDYVKNLLSNVNQQVQSVASSLEDKQPGDLVDDVRRFAARRPGAFLAAALGVGLLAGRATRSAKDSDEIGTDREGAKEYFGVGGQQDRGTGTQQGGQGTTSGVATSAVYDQGYDRNLAATETSEYTPADPYAYRSDEQGEAARTYTDGVPGTVYPEQDGERR